VRDRGERDSKFVVVIVVGETKREREQERETDRQTDRQTETNPPVGRNKDWSCLLNAKVDTDCLKAEAAPNRSPNRSPTADT
jgi:hypothetical protein